MTKTINIDDKLSFDTNPVIQVKGEKLEVNADAETMLKMMGAFKNKSEMDASMEAYELMFSEEDRRKIGKLKLPFKDLMIIIEEAMKLVQGVDEPGEEQTHTTT